MRSRVPSLNLILRSSAGSTKDGSSARPIAWASSVSKLHAIERESPVKCAGTPGRSPEHLGLGGEGLAFAVKGLRA